MMADFLGSIGSYALLRLLWQGSYASVYLGEHCQQHTLAAIKIVHSALAGEEVDHFLAQAQITASLDHPHIVRLLEYGVENGIPFLAMQYIPNGSLRQLHPRGTQLPLSTIVSYVKQVAAALQYIHDQGLIHRDVKPHNMLLGAQNDILLSDFEIAMISQQGGYRREGVSDFEGTILYAAPEQIRTRPRTASDQYSLGIVVYEWLTGDWPFSGTSEEVASQHILISPPSLREKQPAITSTVEQVVLRALEKETTDRFESVQDFAVALERASRLEQTQSIVHHKSPLPFTLPSKPPAAIAPAQTAMLTYRGHTNHIYALTWMPDSSRIASSSLDETIQVWNAATGRTLLTHRSNALKGQALTCSPSGQFIASTTGLLCEVIQVWNAATGENSTQFTPTTNHTETINALAWSPDGTKIASASEDKTVQIWHIHNGSSHLTYRGHTMGVKAVAWSRDNKRLASASEDKTVQVWNADTGRNQIVYYGHRDKVNTLCWSPDGSKIASASDDGTVHVWDTSSGRKLLVYSGHTGLVTAVSWSPDGSRIASGGIDET
ncbi:MAG TPA: serine/threonine-protein kinase, partial [Ktedonobacteraceae bacterium]|nr:serine/threonine-protein kinase [Ktedonobacteraceae bacterium]